MIRLNVIVEGLTEERFVRDMLAAALWPKEIYPTARVLGKPGHKGGRVNYARVKSDLQLLLKQERDTFCTTLIDFYRLGIGFPGNSIIYSDNRTRADGIQEAIKCDIAATLDPALRTDLRLFPYIQMHEFEALLFSDPQALAESIYQPQLAGHFEDIRQGFTSPEDIDDGPQTAPSMRIKAAFPAYRKVIDGALASDRIGLETIRGSCPRFAAWLSRIEALAVS